MTKHAFGFPPEVEIFSFATISRPNLSSVLKPSGYAAKPRASV
jgi:hypothetical protein